MDSASDIVKQIQEQIGEGRRFQSENDMAQFFGLGETKHTKLYNFFGGSDTGYKSVLEWIDKLGGSVVFDNEPQLAISGVRAHSPVEPVQGDDLISIPIYEIAGAGQDFEVQSAEALHNITILRKYAKKGTFAIAVGGDSMEPTIKKGAHVGIDPMLFGNLDEGEIYLVRRPPFGVVVKRIFPSKDGTGLVLKSDNTKWEDQFVPFDGYDNLIIGKVIWILQSV